jgi:hypothetical protein
MVLQYAESYFITLCRLPISQSDEPTETIILDGSQVRLCKVIKAAYFKASGLLHSAGNAEENHETLNQNQ